MTTVEFVIAAGSAFEEILTGVIDECVDFVRSVVSVVSLCDNKEDVGSDSNEDKGADSDDVGKEGDDVVDVEDGDDETCDLEVEMLSVTLI